jgi:putative transposase
MARLPRLVVAGQLHLVMLRAHGSQPVFRAEEDFVAYRHALVQAAAEHRIALHAYAFTPSQVLLLVTPATAEGPSRMLQAVGRRFGADYNRRYQRSGALWDGRFRATVLEPALLTDASRWVEWAPVRAGLAATPAEHPWSSASHHVGLRVDPDITEHPHHWRLGNTPFEREAVYRGLLEHPLPLVQETRFENAVGRGWALGDATFVRTIGEQAPRRVAPLARGRPRKKHVPL